MRSCVPRLMHSCANHAGFSSVQCRERTEARASGKALDVVTNLDTGQSSLRPIEGAAFVNRYEPPRRLLIVGAVQIAQALTGLARELGQALHLEHALESRTPYRFFTERTKAIDYLNSEISDERRIVDA